jgi:hypothetical protein
MSADIVLGVFEAIEGGLSGAASPLYTFFAAGAEEVRQGKIVGVAAVLLHSDGGIGTGWAGELKPYTAIGALHVLARELQAKLIEDGEVGNLLR